MCCFFVIALFMKEISEKLRQRLKDLLVVLLLIQNSNPKFKLKGDDVT